MAAAKLDTNEMCPVCKTSKYLNKRMKFMVNPECYHKMCDACVDRIFSQGPAPCPIAGCNKTLRKNRFKEPRFEDLAIERECDIRARVAKILNHREEDFESLRAFNDYEEWKESTVWKLVHGSADEIAETQRRLTEHARENADSISRNSRISRGERDAVHEAEESRRVRAERGREEALRQVEEERREREASRRDVVERIVSAQPGRAGRTAAVVTAMANKKKESKAREQQAGGANVDVAAQNGMTTRRRGLGQDASAGAKGSTTSAAAAGAAASPSSSSGFNIPGLKKAVFVSGAAAADDDDAYDPFDGLTIHNRYYHLLASYHHPWSNEVSKRLDHIAGGFLPADYQVRAQREAHAGLGVIIGREKMKEGEVH